MWVCGYDVKTIITDEDDAGRASLLKRQMSIMNV